jgi:hypothetical protein
VNLSGATWKATVFHRYRDGKNKEKNECWSISSVRQYFQKNFNSINLW